MPEAELKDAARTVQLFFQDLAPGRRFPGVTQVCTAEAFAAFAKLTGDAHPIHYDQAYAAGTRFGRPVAHGLLLAAYSALGATPLSRHLEQSMIAMLEVNFRFQRPAFVGDELVTSFLVEASRWTRARDAGLVRFAVDLRRFEGDIVMEGSHSYLIRARGFEG